MIIRTKRGKTYLIGKPFMNQYNKTVLLSAAIRAIYDKDAQLTPEEQQDAIKLLPGLSAAEMESIIMPSGPALADSIRSMISKHRARNRTIKDRAD